MCPSCGTTHAEPDDMFAQLPGGASRVVARECICLGAARESTYPSNELPLLRIRPLKFRVIPVSPFVFRYRLVRFDIAAGRENTAFALAQSHGPVIGRRRVHEATFGCLNVPHIVDAGLGRRYSHRRRVGCPWARFREPGAGATDKSVQGIQRSV